MSKKIGDALAGSRRENLYEPEVGGDLRNTDRRVGSVVEVGHGHALVHRPCPACRDAHFSFTYVINQEEEMPMHVVNQKDLAFVGMSHQFIGAEHGTGVSVYLVESPPGRKTQRHRHPYDEIAFVREGRGRWTVDGETREAEAGDILVVKAGQIHE